jgi:hypothetical protein
MGSGTAQVTASGVGGGICFCSGRPVYLASFTASDEYLRLLQNPSSADFAGRALTVPGQTKKWPRESGLCPRCKRRHRSIEKVRTSIGYGHNE